MSGRSAYVRKEKTKVKDGAPTGHQEGESDRSASIGDFPVPLSTASSMAFQHPSMQHPGMQLRNHQPYSHGDLLTIKSGSTGSEERGYSRAEERGYARVQKPIVPIIIDSGIEKSTFRSMMDKKSEGVRDGLAKTFGRKKKKEERRPPTSNTVRGIPYELDAGGSVTTGSYGTLPAGYQKSGTMYGDSQYGRPGPPQSKLPPLPHVSLVKRWQGGNRPAHPWNKLRKDPELWDPTGDTLIYYGRKDPYGPKPEPSYRVSSHVIERTESKFLVTMLRQGLTQESAGYGMPPSPAYTSPIHSPAMPVSYPVHPGQQRYHQTPPISEVSGFEGQISYEIFFDTPGDLTEFEILRNQLTIHNVFAVICQASLAGFNLYQTLCDVQERLEEWMPAKDDAGAMVIDYLVGKGFDDVRNNISSAVCLMAWSERPSILWADGWTEGFVHCCGMYNRLATCPDKDHISPVTDAHITRASCEMQIRVDDAEHRLSDFDFTDMWPKMSSQSPPARESFEKAREFFLSYYKNIEGRWPPLVPAAEDQWLTREWAQRLQADFGALYDYIVDRSVVWDGSEERSGRKWNIIKPGDRAFDVDTADLPFTDLLVAFDNRHAYPHIPRPYCRVPASTAIKKSTPDNMFRSSKRSAKPAEDKIAQTKAALAYTNSTNVFILGHNFERNDLVEEFIKFEKSNSIHVDPFAARRGRWVLIYGILQVLATVSVDTPSLRYFDKMAYHMSPQLHGTPPWKERMGSEDDGGHTKSYCWTTIETWNKQPFKTIHPTENGMPTKVNAMIRGDQSGTPSGSDNEGKSLKKTPGFGPGLSVKPKRVQQTRADGEKNASRQNDHNPNPVANSYAPRMPERLENQNNNTYATRAADQSLNNSFSRSDTSGGDQRKQVNTGIPRMNERNDLNRAQEPAQHTASVARAQDPGQYIQISTRNARPEPLQYSRNVGMSNTGYAPGIEKVEEWPIREESRQREDQYDESRGTRDERNRTRNMQPRVESYQEFGGDGARDFEENYTGGFRITDFDHDDYGY